MHERAITEIKNYAIDQGYSFELENLTDDEKVLNAKLSKGEIELHVLFLKVKSDYLAYGISSTGLPSEIYSDIPKQGFTEAERSQEIVSTVKSILDKSASKDKLFCASGDLNLNKYDTMTYMYSVWALVAKSGGYINISTLAHGDGND